jgi:dTDP-3-amino-2,3,6-trideoxy-4-keto-D-glucose/dTDP-3-amino-3,4,6-trideoxy-alpha-D-glucose/dTDP-2,6-dideoxy-D-kanosamine transaminase
MELTKMTAKTRTVPYNYLPQQFPPAADTADGANITTRILDRLHDVIIRGDFTLGREVGEFEDAWAKVVGASMSIGVSNGTDAIALGLEAAGLQPGEEVATSPTSFIATSGAIVQARGIPVYQDIVAYNNPSIIPASASSELKWAVPVLWAGSPSGLGQWNDSNFKVVVDSAQGMNALSGGSPLGALKNIYAFAYSLHPLKNVNVIGDGGVIATNDSEVDSICRLLRNHGLKGRDEWMMYGYNARLSTIQAAVGLEVLPTWVDMDSRRQANATILTDGIGQIDGMTPPIVDDGDGHGWHLYQPVLNNSDFSVTDRDELNKFLNTRGVESKVHYPIPLHAQKANERFGFQHGQFPNAEAYADLHITLPVHEYLDDNDMNYILEALREWIHAGS